MFILRLVLALLTFVPFITAVPSRDLHAAHEELQVRQTKQRYVFAHLVVWNLMLLI